MKYSLKQGGVVAGLCLYSLVGFAQTTPTELDDIVVTASRTSEKLADASGDITVISQEQLQNSRGESLGQILAKVPGVQMSNYGGPQTATSIFMRGTNSNHVLVLIDGMRINAGSSGGANLQAVDPAMIERIEILRGSASSLYGSDAIGGVINIITKRGQQDQPFSTWGSLGTGTHHTTKGTIGFSGAQKSWDYSVATSEAKSDGFNATNQTNESYHPDKDGYKSRSITGTIGYNWAGGQRLQATAYNGYIQGDYDADNWSVFPPQPLPNVYNRTRQEAYGIESQNQLADWWRSKVQIGYTKDSSSEYESDPSMPSYYNSFERQYALDETFAIADGHKMTVIGERKEKRLQTDAGFAKTRRNVNAVGLIYRAHVDDWHVQASGRNDHYTGYGNQATGSLAVDYDLDEAWQVGIAGNTGFHAPTFNDLFGPFGANPNLKPEKSRNIEAHLSFEQGSSQAQLTVYQNKVRDLIDLDALTFLPYNVGKSTIRGLTLEGRQGFGSTTIYGSVDFLDPRNDDTNEQLIRRAKRVVHLGLEQQIKALTLGAEYQYHSRRPDGGQWLAGYGLANLTANYELSKELSFNLRWDNIFNKDYQLVQGYQTPGRTVFGSVAWQFN